MSGTPLGTGTDAAGTTTGSGRLMHAVGPAALPHEVFVGREHELDVLDALLAEVCARGAGVALVRGAAGIGKTALVRAFVRRHPDLTVVRGSGDEGEATVSYTLVDQLFAAMGLRAAALLAHTERVLPVEEPIVVGRQVLAVLTRRSATEPVVLVIDDAHRADVDSLRAMLFALRRLAAHPVLTVLVVPLDDAHLPAGFQRLASGLTGATLQVGPLAPVDVQALSAAVTGTQLPGLTAHRLCAHTLGNPRHILALLAEAPSDSWGTGDHVLPAPRVYSRTIGRRLAACSDGARRLVEAAAVVGDGATLATVAALADVLDPLTALEEACAAGLLDTLECSPALSLGFAHPLARAAIYGQLTAVRRLRLHREAAQLVDDERAALHHRVSAARPPDEALAAELQRFSDRVRTVADWAEAAWALLESGRLSGRGPQRELRLLRAAGLLGDAGAAASTTTRELGTSAAHGPLRDVTDGYLALLRGRDTDASVRLHASWAGRDDAGPEVATLTAQRLALHGVGRLRGAEVVTWSRRALALAAPDDPMRAEAEALLGLGLGWMRAAVPAGAAREPARVCSAWFAVWSYVRSARRGFVVGAWDEAAAHAERAVALLDGSGHEWLRPLARCAAAMVPAARGEWASAEEHAEAAVARSGDYELMVMSAAVARALVPAARADHDGVLRALEPVTGLAGADQPDLWPWQDLYADALVGAGRLAEAEEFLAPHETSAVVRGRRSTVARLARVRGRLEAAHGRLPAAEAAFGRAAGSLAGVASPAQRALLDLAHGQVLRRAGHRRVAAEHLSAARDRFAGLGAHPYAERCRQELAACGLTPAKRSAFDPSRLTAQELAVARLVAMGMSNRQVASELFISIKTVQFHLTHVYAKVGVRSRAELAATFRDPDQPTD